MILVTHELIGAALAGRYANYATIFFVAFASHYIFDMIPHWHYPVPTIKAAVNASGYKKRLQLDETVMREIIRITIDLGLGLVIALFFFNASLAAVFLAALGATAPDLIVGFGRFYPHPVLAWHDRFHRWIHADTDLDHRPLIGIGSQLAIAVVFVFLFR